MAATWPRSRTPGLEHLTMYAGAADDPSPLPALTAATWTASRRSSGRSTGRRSHEVRPGRRPAGRFRRSADPGPPRARRARPPAGTGSAPGTPWAWRRAPSRRTHSWRSRGRRRPPSGSRCWPRSSCCPRRRPQLVAQAAATLDRLSGGRLILGVGAGGDRPDYEAFDEDWTSSVRVARMDEAVTIVDAFLRGEVVSRRGAGVPGPWRRDRAAAGAAAAPADLDGRAPPGWHPACRPLGRLGSP